MMAMRKTGDLSFSQWLLKYNLKLKRMEWQEKWRWVCECAPSQNISHCKARADKPHWKGFSWVKTGVFKRTTFISLEI